MWKYFWFWEEWMIVFVGHWVTFQGHLNWVKEFLMFSISKPGLSDSHWVCRALQIWVYPCFFLNIGNALHPLRCYRFIAGRENCSALCERGGHTKDFMSAQVWQREQELRNDVTFNELLLCEGDDSMPVGRYRIHGCSYFPLLVICLSSDRTAGIKRKRIVGHCAIVSRNILRYGLMLRFWNTCVIYLVCSTTRLLVVLGISLQVSWMLYWWAVRTHNSAEYSLGGWKKRLATGRTEFEFPVPDLNLGSPFHGCNTIVVVQLFPNSFSRNSLEY